MGISNGAAAEWVSPVAEPWMDSAACAEVDPELFFPERGSSTRDAKKVCGSCEVRAECLEFALRNDERFGLWGGLSERDRRKMLRQRVGRPSPLTERAETVRKLHTQGLTDVEIAQRLDVGPGAVRRSRRGMHLPSNASGGSPLRLQSGRSRAGISERS